MFDMGKLLLVYEGQVIGEYVPEPRRVCHNTLAASLAPPVPKEEKMRRALVETPIASGGLMIFRLNRHAAGF